MTDHTKKASKRQTKAIARLKSMQGNLRKKLLKVQNDYDAKRIKAKLWSHEFANFPTNQVSTNALIDFSTLAENEFFDNIETFCEYNFSKYLFEAGVIINGRYTFSSTSFISFSEAISIALESASNFMREVKYFGSEALIPQKRLDLKMLAAMLELRSGLELENLKFELFFDHERSAWKGKLEIENLFVEASKGTNSKDDIVAELVLDYLLKHCDVKMIHTD